MMADNWLKVYFCTNGTKLLCILICIYIAAGLLTFDPLKNLQI